ncbi:hypothetical protein BG261_02485 [Floricoccus tropicus]|uniref:UDP-N-acetylmuramoylpentapeptide-lysine N(6)-alanyltransferase n=1 Tax=Floricoccus tropicus TaxID=1859473 RepID=A0A1E8GMI5_9LACT|nr:aminoacyltransferase [Floricoccus tropicus]OFI49464.1 hypothetical protein BG261_02485 [Floricoccus tropicus]
MYTYKIGISKEDHDNFVKSSNLVNLLQSSSWAQIKDNWGNERIGFYDNDKLVATANLLIRDLPLGFTMIYVPRGPIMDYTDKDLVNFVIDSLKKYGKTKKALFVKIDPMISYYSFKLGEEKKLNSDANTIIKNIESAGAKWSGLTTDMSETIQPRFNAMLYKEDFSENDLIKKSKNFARKIKKVRKSNTEVKFGKQELVNDFAILMQKTEDRKGVNLRNGEYYSKLLSTYDDAYITIVYLNIKEQLELAHNDLKKALAASENNTSTAEKRLKKLETDILNAQKKVSDAQDIKESYSQDLIPIAGALTVVFGKTAETLYAGTDTYFTRFYPSYLSWLASTQKAFEDEVGATEVNMGGLENSLSESDGLLNFKKNYNPTIEEGIGEFDIPVNKLLFSASELAYKTRKKIRGQH